MIRKIKSSHMVGHFYLPLPLLTETSDFNEWKIVLIFFSPKRFRGPCRWSPLFFTNNQFMNFNDFLSKLSVLKKSIRNQTIIAKVPIPVLYLFVYLSVWPETIVRFTNTFIPKIQSKRMLTHCVYQLADFYLRSVRPWRSL